MGLIRLLVYAVLIWLVWSMIKKHFGRQEQKPRTQINNTPMVRCRFCDLHLPQENAVSDEEGDWFCGQAHKQAYLGKTRNTSWED